MPQERLEEPGHPKATPASATSPAGSSRGTGAQGHGDEPGARLDVPLVGTFLGTALPACHAHGLSQQSQDIPRVPCQQLPRLRWRCGARPAVRESPVPGRCASRRGKTKHCTPRHCACLVHQLRFPTFKQNPSKGVHICNSSRPLSLQDLI